MQFQTETPYQSYSLNGSNDTSMVIVLVSREIVTPFGNFPAKRSSLPYTP